MRCPLCKTENQSGAKFCNECGIRLPQSADASSEEQSSAEADDRKNTPNNHDLRASLETLPTVDQPTQPVRNPSDSLADTAREMGLGFDAQATGEISLDSYYDHTPDEYVKPQFRPDQTMEMPAIADKRSAQTDYRAPEMPDKRKKAPIVIGVVALLAAIIGACAALYAFGIIGGPLVPDVVGMSASAAENVLKEKGLNAEIKQVKSDETENVVLQTDPAAKSHVAKGGTVVLQVATPRCIPDLVGKTLEEAQQLLKDEGLTSVKIEKVKSDDAENVVLEVSPSAGERAKANTQVTVKIAEPYKVPDVTGMTTDQAAAAIEAEGLVAVFASVYNTDVPEGTIVSVDPAAGTAVKSGSEVIVNVARDRGKELVELSRGILAGELTISGQAYEISSIDSLSYAGNDVVNFSVTARAFTYLDGEKVYGSPKSVSGSIYFNADNSYSIS